MAFTDGFLTITFTGGETIERKVRQFAIFQKSFSGDGLVPVWQQIGEDLQADFMLNMVGEGNLGFMATAKRGKAVAGFGGSGGWPALKPATVIERTRLGIGGAHPILWRTGALGESLTSKSAAGSVFQVTPKGVSVGSSIFYAGWHQTGSKDGKLPARPIVGITRARQSAIVARLNDFIVQRLREAGLNG